MIAITVSSVDGFRKRRVYKTLQGARRMAYRYVGETPDLGGWYAVDMYGTTKVEWDGCTAAELFPRLAGPITQ
jgi:hypothetical protein